MSGETKSRPNKKRSAWVKYSHWIVTLAFLILLVTGVLILMVHPRLYWGEVGNDLTPALLELPISKNYQHGGWENKTAFFKTEGAPVSASRNFEIFNQNGWGRSLHFLSAWILILTGLLYLILGVITGHIGKAVWPDKKEFAFNSIWLDLKDHIRNKISKTSVDQPYGVLQKHSYSLVIFLLLPLAVVTGFTMSPAITAAFPWLLDLFGGYQSARTVHFFTSILLSLFLIIHFSMILITGFKKQMRNMV